VGGDKRGHVFGLDDGAEQPQLARQRAGDRDALLLTAG
jgi:hypothetical protein